MDLVKLNGCLSHTNEGKRISATNVKKDCTISDDNGTRHFQVKTGLIFLTLQKLSIQTPLNYQGSPLGIASQTFSNTVTAVIELSQDVDMADLSTWL